MIPPFEYKEWGYRLYNGTFFLHIYYSGNIWLEDFPDPDVPLPFSISPKTRTESDEDFVSRAYHQYCKFSLLQ